MMGEPRCPGQDRRYWKPEDIFEMPCPVCGTEIEFWKDESARTCPKCKSQLRNPQKDLGCAKWCRFGPQCLTSLSLVESPEEGIDRG
jgi:hypothetical protein